MKKLNTIATSSLFALVSLPALGADVSTWDCKHADEEELRVTFVLNHEDGSIASLHYFDNDSWYELACSKLVGAAPSFRSCLLTEEAAIFSATLSDVGRSRFKEVNLLTVDRFTNETTTNSFRCLPAAQD